MSVLNGVLVVSLEQSVAAPLCSRILADLGARVIKVERPGTGDLSRGWDRVLGPWSSIDLWVNPNKESLTLNLKHPGGREALWRLLSKADVCLESFTPGTAGGLGITYEGLRAKNPRIVYAHVSGYGQDGPYRDKRAMDMLIQGEAGLIDLTGSESEPARLAASVADISAGHYAAIAVLAALHHAARTGEGQEADVSMFEATASLLGYWAFRYFYVEKNPTRMGMRHPLIVPYGVYEAKDGTVNLCISTEPMWRRFCEAIGRSDFLADPGFGTNEKRLANRRRLEPAIEEALRSDTRARWLERLDAAGIPCGSVNRLDEVFSHPQIEHRRMVRSLPSAYGEVRVFDLPVKLSRTPGEIRRLPPELGEHTDAILREIGYADAEIASLRRDGAV